MPAHCEKFLVRTTFYFRHDGQDVNVVTLGTVRHDVRETHITTEYFGIFQGRGVVNLDEATWNNLFRKFQGSFNATSDSGDLVDCDEHDEYGIHDWNTTDEGAPRWCRICTYQLPGPGSEFEDEEVALNARDRDGQSVLAIARRQEPYSSLAHPAGPCLMGCGLCAAY